MSTTSSGRRHSCNMSAYRHPSPGAWPGHRLWLEMSLGREVFISPVPRRERPTVWCSRRLGRSLDLRVGRGRCSRAGEVNVCAVPVDAE